MVLIAIRIWLGRHNLDIFDDQDLGLVIFFLSWFPFIATKTPLMPLGGFHLFLNHFFAILGSFFFFLLACSVGVKILQGFDSLFLNISFLIVLWLIATNSRYFVCLSVLLVLRLDFGADIIDFLLISSFSKYLSY